MTNEVETKIKSFVATEDAAAKAWLGTNWIPYAAGLISGIILSALVLCVKYAL